MNNNHCPTIEWAPFEVKGGVSDEKIIRAAQAVEDGFLAEQPGYIKRSLLKDSNDQWVDIVYWHSEEEAQTAAAKAMESPVGLWRGISGLSIRIFRLKSSIRLCTDR